MTPETIEKFRSSLLRCLSNLHFLERFYHEFLNSSPGVAKAFEHTNMERQKAMLNASLYQLMNFHHSKDEQSKKHLQKLGAQHGIYGHKIPPHMYDLWLESLMKAVQESDPQFDASLETIWREVMTHGIDAMKASSHLYPPGYASNQAKNGISVSLEAELKQILAAFKQHAQEASHRSDYERDIEVTAFQFGQYRAYIHAYETLKDAIEKNQNSDAPLPAN